MGKAAYIGLDTRYARIIADTIEAGLGIRTALANVNAALSEDGVKVGPPGKEVGHVGYTAVLNCYHSMKPVVTTIKTRKQGSHDPESDWARACNRFAVQLCVRFNIKPHQRPRLTELIEWGMAPMGATHVPPGYDPRRMPSLCLERVAFWDETHRKVRLGNTTSNGTVVVIPRDEHGNPDPNGEVREVEHALGVKYPGEVRFCLGVHLEGRCRPFSYTECMLLTIDDFESHIKLELQRVRGLADGRTAGWVTNGRAQGAVYDTDSPAVLPWCSDAKAEHLRDLGITTVSQVRDAASIAPWKGVSSATILKWVAAAEAASSDVPEAVDHRRAANPYLARYGEADWRTKVEASTSMGKFKCVTEMIDHMVAETKRVGCTHFYHDALALMTAKSTVLWMTEKGYIDMWVRPMHGIIDEFKQFKGSPPGNRPEWMPLDTYLNRDIHEGVLDLAGHTKRYDDKDERKFRLDTPKHLQRSYERAWEGCPSDERIRQDVKKWEDWVAAVHLARGVVLKNVARDGRRKELGGPGDNRGGLRVKKEPKPEKWVHEDAIPGRDALRSGGRAPPPE